MRNLIPVCTVHAANPMGDVYGFVYQRPNGGYIGMVEIKARESSGIVIYHPELPVVYDDRRAAHDAVADKVMDFDWALDHPWMQSLARTNAVTLEDPDGFDDIVEDMIHDSGMVGALPVEHAFDLESMVI